MENMCMKEIYEGSTSLLKSFFSL